MALRLVFLSVLIFVLLPLYALMADVPVDPDALKDPVAEERARSLMKEVRCLVCQNQSIEDSNAEIAKSLRTLVRDRVAAGESDDQIKAYLVEKYGDWVMLKPPLDGRTLFLWGSPFLLGLGGLAIILLRRRTAPKMVPAEALSAEDEQRVAELMGDTAPDGATAEDSASA